MLFNPFWRITYLGRIAEAQLALKIQGTYTHPAAALCCFHKSLDDLHHPLTLHDEMWHVPAALTES